MDLTHLLYCSKVRINFNPGLIYKKQKTLQALITESKKRGKNGKETNFLHMSSKTNKNNRNINYDQCFLFLLTF